MTELSNISDLLNRATGGNSGTPEVIFFSKTSRIGGVAATAPVTGRMMSLWTTDGTPSGAPVPTTGVILDNTSTGGLKQTDPGGSRQKWLYQFGFVGSTGATVLLYDRLFEDGGFSGTSTSPQTVQGNPASPAITRYTNGIGNQILVEINTAIGGTATTISASYTNQAGTTGRTTVATTFGGSNNNTQGRAFILPLQAGDTGVQAVESVTLAATTGTAGNFSVAIIHPIAFAGTGAAGHGGFRDFTVGLPGIPEVKTDACLGMLYTPTSTTALEPFGCLSFVES